MNDVSGTLPRPASMLAHGIRTVHARWWVGARDRVAVPLVALGVSAGYYAGSLVGLQLRMPPATPSVVWPPNAVLTSALLLTPPRRWWLVLIAALPAHMYLQLGTGWPLALILSLFVTNCLEALLAAGGLYALSDAPTRFDTLRRLTVFFLAAVAAATLSSFADAGAVAWLQGEAYWQVWQTRLLSNVLAALTVVPALVGGAGVLRRWWTRRGGETRAIEALILCVALCAVGWVAVNGSFNVPALRALSNQTPLAVQLPFLLWAALRFGPAGTALTLLTTTLLNGWEVVHGEGPYTSIAPATTITALILSLIVVTTTLLYLATLIEEWTRTQNELRRRLRFEELLTRFSTALVQQPSHEMHRTLESGLGPIGSVLGIEALTLFSASDGTAELDRACSWTDAAAGPRERVAEQHLCWARDSLDAGAPIAMSDAGVRLAFAPPAAAAADRDRTFGGAIPLIGEAHTLGVLAFGPINDDRRSVDLMRNAQLVGEVLASALGRKRSEDARRQTEVMNSAILRSLTSGVAVVDRTGTLIQANEAWVRLAGVCAWTDVRVGGNIIEQCRMVPERDRTADTIVAGVTSVLEGMRTQFSVEYSTDDESGPRWWAVTAVPLNRIRGGAVITCANITELRRAEMEAQRSRQQLAHVSRVSTVGEMTASVAHQLNQPLAAILTNAQVAQRMLAAAGMCASHAVDAPAVRDGSASGYHIPVPEFVELRMILRDIVADDQRASEVISRLRRLLSKGELEMAWFDLTRAIREVVELASSEAAVRGVDIAANVDGAVLIRADRVHLQQVVLNLLQNAMEAMNGCLEARRRVVVGCHRMEDDAGQIHVSVRDTGPGLPDGAEEAVFEPFYTTKAGGMGIGLSIVRSIVEAHGGSIRAVRDPDGGACFELWLPKDGTRLA